MFAKTAVVAAVVLMTAPAVAREKFGVDYGRNDNRHYQHGRRGATNRSGAWIGNHPHGGQWGGAHGHFSPRGQGGYHWGW
jgi:hypothetical protein